MLVWQLVASDAELERLVADARQTLIELQQRANDAKAEYARLEDDVIDFRDEIVSPLSSRSKSDNGIPSSTASTRTLVERLQGMRDRIHALEDAHTLFGYLAKAEELSLIAKEQIKLPTPDDALKTYKELIEFVHTVTRLPTASQRSLRVAPFVRELAANTWRELAKALEAYMLLLFGQSVR